MSAAFAARVGLWCWLKLPLWLNHGPELLQRVSWWWLPHYGSVGWWLEFKAAPEKWDGRERP